MNRLRAFEKIPMNEQTALLLARTILSDSFVISAELRALETTILPFANAFLARLLFSHDELVDYSSNEHVNISVIESASSERLNRNRLQFIACCTITKI